MANYDFFGVFVVFLSLFRGLLLRFLFFLSRKAVFRRTSEGLGGLFWRRYAACISELDFVDVKINIYFCDSLLYC